MNNLYVHMEKYLTACEYRKKLSLKTLKAYQIDLKQFASFASGTSDAFSKTLFSDYITLLHRQYKPKTVKRKIASLKAFIAYLEFEEIIDSNPLSKIQLRFQEPFHLPRTIPFKLIKKILHTAYAEHANAYTPYEEKAALRNIAVLEMLFAIGLRVSELCKLRPDDVNLQDGAVKVFGKGSKERILQIGNPEVLKILKQYRSSFGKEIASGDSFFINRLGNRLSEQSVRSMIQKYTEKAGIHLHITPHMFRHTFATLLLEEDVDIRYIQKMLGHSSIVTTQIYTHVTSKKQKKILASKHPRNKLFFDKK